MSQKVRKLKQVKGKVRGDMYQPGALLTLSILIFAIGICCGVGTYISGGVYNYVITAIFIIAGIFLFLLWKNQKIKIISNKEFEYTGIFGKKKTYAFSSIKGLKRMKGFAYLLAGGNKLPIVRTSVMSPELIKLIDAAMGVKKNG